MTRVAGVIALSTFCLAVADATVAAGENWPGWRGPDRNGVSAESGVPVRWSETDGVAWKKELPGSGISSAVVWDDRIFVTASDGPRRENLHVICLSRDSGETLWHQRFWGTSPTLYHAAKSSMASPTPVTNGRHLFAFFGTGDVFCIDVDGELIWQRSLAEEYGRFENRFAASSSPVLYRELLILQCDHYGDSYLIALDQQAGTNYWKTDRPETWLSWSSPQLIELESGDELIVSGSHKLDAFDPRSGSKLWTVTGLQRECIPTPLFAHGLVYAVSGPNGDTFAVQPGGRGDVTKSRVKWRNPRGAPFVPSAILVGDYYYLIGDRGIGTCLDAHTGQKRWQHRFPGQYTASPVAAGKSVYFTNEEGTTVVIEADRADYHEIARNDLNEPVFATPSISQGRIYLRTARHLYAIGDN